jgi:hypothetical protein
MEETLRYPSALLESVEDSQYSPIPPIPIILRCSLLFLLACVTVFANNYAHLDDEEVTASLDEEEKIT